jgi:hypothetical protein
MRVVESDYADNAAFSLILIKGDSAHVVPRSHARSVCSQRTLVEPPSSGTPY